MDFLPKSDIRVPAAEGGGRGMGAWIAEGVGSRVKVFGDAEALKEDTGVDLRDT